MSDSIGSAKQGLSDDAADALIEAVGDRIGMHKGAWDMVDGRELARAFAAELHAHPRGRFAELRSNMSIESQERIEADAIKHLDQWLGQFRDGVEQIAAERERQVEVEGWTPEHDDTHQRNELLSAAMTYLLHAMGGLTYEVLDQWWPFDDSWWKPDTPQRDLQKAGALIAAHLDLLRRQAGRAS